MSISKLIFAIEHAADSLSSSNYELSKVIGSCTDSIISSNDKVIEGLGVISDTINSPRPYDWLVLVIAIANVLIVAFFSSRLNKISQRQTDIQNQSFKQNNYNLYKSLYNDIQTIEMYINSFEYKVYDFVRQNPNYEEVRREQDVLAKLQESLPVLKTDFELMLSDKYLAYIDAWQTIFENMNTIYSALYYMGRKNYIIYNNSVENLNTVDLLNAIRLIKTVNTINPNFHISPDLNIDDVRELENFNGEIVEMFKMIDDKIRIEESLNSYSFYKLTRDQRSDKIKERWIYFSDNYIYLFIGAIHYEVDKLATTGSIVEHIKEKCAFYTSKDTNN